MYDCIGLGNNRKLHQIVENRRKSKKMALANDGNDYNQSEKLPISIGFTGQLLNQ